MKHLHRFFSSDASGGIILIIAAVLAMIMANSGATSGWYHDFLETPVQLRVGTLEINKNMLLWINDALMAVFFLLVGLEVKPGFFVCPLNGQSAPGGISCYCRNRRDDCPGIALSGF